MGPTDSQSSAAWVPRLLSFYRDEDCDAAGNVTGYENVAWGVRWYDGSVVTLEDVSTERPPAIRIWAGLDQAVTGLDALVCGFAPQRSVRESRATPNEVP